MEELLNKLIEKGWKPRDIENFIYRGKIKILRTTFNTTTNVKFMETN